MNIRRISLMMVGLLVSALIMVLPVVAGQPSGKQSVKPDKLGSSPGQKHTYSLAVVTKPGASQTVLAERFAQLVKQASGGAIQVKVYHSQAKGDESQILDQLKKGSLNLAVVTAGVFDKHSPLTRAVEYPFLFDSYAQVDKVLQGAPGRKVLDSLKAAGMQGLAFGENGFRHLTNNKQPVAKVQDLKGLRVRVMESALQQELWQKLGATPIPHPWPIEELLAGGGADGQENPLWVIWLYRLDKLQKHLTLTGHVYSAHICAANLAWFQALPLAEQKMLAKAMSQAAAYQRELNRKNEQKALSQLKGAGMQVNEKPDLASFKHKLEGLADRPLFAVPGLKNLLHECRQAMEKP
jgi:tripartite ATP-independent transporter DctP family solute receptor